MLQEMSQAVCVFARVRASDELLLSSARKNKNVCMNDGTCVYLFACASACTFVSGDVCVCICPPDKLARYFCAESVHACVLPVFVIFSKLLPTSAMFSSLLVNSEMTVSPTLGLLQILNIGDGPAGISSTLRHNTFAEGRVARKKSCI